jgi:hypothetical protein
MDWPHFAGFSGFTITGTGQAMYSLEQPLVRQRVFSYAKAGRKIPFDFTHPFHRNILN